MIIFSNSEMGLFKPSNWVNPLSGLADCYAPVTTTGSVLGAMSIENEINRNEINMPWCRHGSFQFSLNGVLGRDKY